MSLGKKTVALFLVLGISFCFGAYGALKLTVFPTFEEFENRSAAGTLTRVNRVLESDLRALEIMNIEYSAWNDTYDYAQGRMPEYTDENMDPAYWHSNDINLMAIFDATGNRLFANMADPVTGEPMSIDEAFYPPLGPEHPLVGHETVNDSVIGLIETRFGIMQVVSRPILTGVGAGPVAGALIVGQFLTDERVRELGDRATADVILHSLTDGRRSPQVEAAREALLNADKSLHLIVDDESAYAYQIVPDVLGAPVVVLEVSTPREVTQIGAATVRTATTFLAIASLVFLLAAWVFMHRLITAPVKKLTKLILGVKKSGDLNIDIHTNRADEVGVLAREFGDLASRLNSARDELEQSRDSAVAMSDAKSDFLARMSHEIRTPMNGVLGMTELLRETKLDDKQHRFARTIYESAESLLQIINDILDISKIEAGKIELDVAPFNLRNVVEECLEALAETAHRKGLELVCGIPVNTHPYVRGDAVRLRQILMNLVGNAVKFTEEGEIVVRVVECDGTEGNYRFEVSDTGVGIKSESAAKIFEPFAQEDGSTTRKYGGTGLGLSISKQLVELMDGEIGLDAAVGQGCVFWFTAQLSKDEATSELPNPGLFINRQVLVVDDNATNREIMCHQLESWGMQATSASSGADALKVLNRKSGNNFDAILLDMSMPEMDGLQLWRAIQESGAYSGTPVVMLSSLSRADIRNEQKISGPKDWLTKPVRQARLYDALFSALSNATVATAERQTEHAANDGNAEGGLSILLADDNPVNREVGAIMLESLGHKIAQVENGVEAVAAVKSQRFDVVLMDCRMPELDGYDATRGIRHWEQETGQVPLPIVALTANAVQGDREICLDAGMDDYLSKPFTKAQLRSVLDVVTASRDMPREDASPRAGGRILVVDDNVVNLQVTSAMLCNLGYESQVASSGDEALRAISEDTFDLILMDCHMPGLDGYETAREVRLREEQRAEGVRIPIVALTADFLESNRQKCLDAGMDDYATKPVTQAHLRILLDRWLIGAGADDARTEGGVDDDGFSKLGDTLALASIDREVLDEIRSLDKTPGASILREIVLSYCALSTKLMLQLRSALAEGDPQLVEQIAHSMKGGSSQVGAILLANIFDEMIRDATSGDLSNLHALCERAAIEHSSVISGLDKELQSAAA